MGKAKERKKDQKKKMWLIWEARLDWETATSNEY